MSNEVSVAKKPQTLAEIVSSPQMQSKLQSVWGNPTIANTFASSIISIGNGSAAMRKCDPMSIISGAMVAATLQLQIIPTLGQCYLIPYGNKAQVQIGYLGILQLCMRSGQFKRILAVPVHEGELVSGDEFNEDWTFDSSKKKNDKVVGFYAKFELINGFVKAAYWPLEKVKAHATKFSQAFRSGKGSPWQSDFEAMACKTVLKSILKYAPKSVEMQRALSFDQAVAKTDATADNLDELNIDFIEPEYVDNPNNPVADAVAEEVKPSDTLFDGAEG